MLRTPFVLAFWLGAIWSAAAQAHEFWIEPETYEVARGERIVAAIRVGEQFEGSSYAYIPQNFVRFDMVQGDVLSPVDGRAGDRPAANVEARVEGLAVLVHVTGNRDLTYDSFANFERFVRSKGADWVLEAHRDRGFGEEDPTEIYSRYAKSLIAVGAGAGEDRAFGLVTEIVALENPYTGGAENGLDVEVRYDGQPRPNAQIEVFSKAAGETVQMQTMTTDAEGRATIDVVPGRAYLVNSVVMREPVGDAETMWESLWASLTFRVPD